MQKIKLNASSSLSFKDHQEILKLKKAMVKEMSVLHDNGTWEIVPLPPGKKNN